MIQGRKERRKRNLEVEYFAKILAAKYNLPVSVVVEICRSEFLYVNKIINEGKFESIRLAHLGIFGVKRFRIKYIPKKVLEKVIENGGNLTQRYLNYEQENSIKEEIINKISKEE
jgi:hypothetical protein